MEKSIEKLPRVLRHPSDQKVVLVIDDSEDLLTLSRTILELEDYKVVTAMSAEEAFAVLSEIECPDLILLDMQLGEISGPEFLVELEEKRPEVFKRVPVVFLSAMDKVPPSKAVGFIRKPMDMDNFLTAVHRYIEGGTDNNLRKH